MGAWANHSVWTCNAFFSVLLCLQGCVKEFFKTNIVCHLIISSMHSFLYYGCPHLSFSYSLCLWESKISIPIFGFSSVIMPSDTINTRHHLFLAWLNSTAVLAISPPQSASDKLALNLVAIHRLLHKSAESHTNIRIGTLRQCPHICLFPKTNSCNWRWVWTAEI